MSSGSVVFERAGPVARLTFDRREAMNAMTTAMYEEFETVCRQLAEPGEIRAVVLRGAGGRAFVAGSDIAEFAGHAGEEEGLVYERRMDRILDALAAIPVPTVAVIEGLAVGGGLNIAGACDLRIATVGSRFGVPIACTLGNCLSMRNYARLVGSLGEARAKRMLLLAELLTTDDLDGSGFLARVVEPDDLEAAIESVVGKVLGGAPLSLAASKAAIGRLAAAALPEGDDLIRLCYGSEDLQEGIAAFREKRRPNWRGR